MTPYTSILLALGLLAGVTAAASAETISPFECRIDGPMSTPLWSEVFLNKTATVRLICPFKNSLNGYRVRFYDGDGRGGNQSIKVDVGQPTYANDINNLGHLHMIVCNTFRSNSHTGEPGLANVACPGVTTTQRSYQMFIVELWSRAQRTNIQLLGIETW